MIKQIPSISQCLEFFDRYEMLDNIRAHSFMVARVAEALVDGLHRTELAAEPLPDLAEATAGALLHDIAKTLCLQNACHHAEAGQHICIELGYPEIGEVVAEHVVLKTFSAELYEKGVFGTKEIVFYADKRVRHDQVVPLADRLEYILERYGDGNPLKEKYIKLNFQRTLDLEKFLFSFLDFTPEQIEQHISWKSLPA
jgi:putative nucleotidyltransferase with HDIG domain